MAQNLVLQMRLQQDGTIPYYLFDILMSFFVQSPWKLKYLQT